MGFIMRQGFIRKINVAELFVRGDMDLRRRIVKFSSSGALIIPIVIQLQLHILTDIRKVHIAPVGAYRRGRADPFDRDLEDRERHSKCSRQWLNCCEAI
jgi:hypothetical protein